MDLGYLYPDTIKKIESDLTNQIEDTTKFYSKNKFSDKEKIKEKECFTDYIEILNNIVKYYKGYGGMEKDYERCQKLKTNTEAFLNDIIN